MKNYLGSESCSDWTFWFAYYFSWPTLRYSNFGIISLGGVPHYGNGVMHTPWKIQVALLHKILPIWMHVWVSKI